VDLIQQQICCKWAYNTAAAGAIENCDRVKRKEGKKEGRKEGSRVVVLHRQFPIALLCFVPRNVQKDEELGGFLLQRGTKQGGREEEEE
jgi:hypothetical protein